MDYIYMDNFRGFRDTVLPLREVNFLVGENSTGKTSFLALLELLANFDFWFTQDFNGRSYEFGGFSDIISAGATNKEEFRIGLGRTPRADAKNQMPACFLMHFRERGAAPALSMFTQATDDWVGTIVPRRGGLQYRTEKIKNVCHHASDASCLLRAVESYAQRTTPGFSRVPRDIGFRGRAMMAQFPSILHLLAGEKKKYKMHYGFPAIAPDIVVLAPIRTMPKRTYDGYPKPFSPEGEHTPYLLRKQLSAKSKAPTFKAALEKFGKDSGLFRSVGITQFGRGPSGPFEVTVTLGDQPLRVNSVGYGVSQALPVVVELISRSRGTWFSIQQPEIHLHPRAQAALGDLLFVLARDEKKTLFVETHSDYTIDRFRLNYRQSRGPDSQVLFFERTADGNRVRVVPIMDNGEYPEEQPPSFRTFFIQEQQRILGI
jgi:hypothetical protein